MSDQPSIVFIPLSTYASSCKLETPGLPGSFGQPWDAQVSVDFNISSAALDGDRYQVELTLSAQAVNNIARTAANGTQTKELHPAYKCEIQVAGVYQIGGVNQAQLDEILNVHCPGMLFPYAKEYMESSILRTAFPVPQLRPIDFMTAYEERLKAQG